MTARAASPQAASPQAASPRSFWVAVSAALALGSACILPDRDIIIEDEDISNKYPVRFAEPTALPEETEAECGMEGCPQPGLPQRHFLDPTFTNAKGERPYDFCSCSSGQSDSKALLAFTLYIEDRDEEPRTRKIKDSIFAALQLDLDPTDPDPVRAIAYLNYVNPEKPLSFADIDYEPLKRPNPHLRKIQLGDEDQKLDLCNRAQPEPLSVGYHSLRVIVSDRAWYKRVTEDGETFTQAGVPDLAKGATFDTITFVFRCDEKREDDPDTPEVEDDHCVAQCKDPDEEGL